MAVKNLFNREPLAPSNFVLVTLALLYSVSVKRPYLNPPYPLCIFLLDDDFITRSDYFEVPPKQVP